MADEHKDEGQWRQPSPYDSNDETSSSSGNSTEYEEEVPTPQPEKKRKTEEDDDPNYNVEDDQNYTHRASTQSSRMKARYHPEDDTETERRDVRMKLLV